MKQRTTRKDILTKRVIKSILKFIHFQHRYLLVGQLRQLRKHAQVSDLHGCWRCQLFRCLFVELGCCCQALCCYQTCSLETSCLGCHSQHFSRLLIQLYIYLASHVPFRNTSSTIRPQIPSCLLQKALSSRPISPL